jgi:TonB family protein
LGQPPSAVPRAGRNIFPRDLPNLQVMATGGRRATRLGGGLSLLFHAGLFAVITSRPHLSVRGELTPPAVAFELQASPLEDPAPAARTASPAAKARGTSRSVARRAPKVMTTFSPEASIPSLASPQTGDPSEESEPEEPAPPSPAVARLEKEAIVPPAKAPVITPDTARALRVYDTYPMLLAQASLTRAEVLVEVCVSDHGQVSDAVIAQGGMAAIDHTLRTAIRSWRYRPLLVNGAPTPFCHFMRIKYALN